MLHWNGVAWETVRSLVAPHWGFSMLSPSSGWIAIGRAECSQERPRYAPPCSNSGAVGYWNGTIWTSQFFTEEYGINDIQAIGPELVWSVGYANYLDSAVYAFRLISYLSRWDGQAWAVVSTLPDTELSLLSVVGRNDVWASDRGATIYHYPAP
ncbi:MAG: hypothetical protein U0641_12765 [Anaerolineae bacterium]